MSFNLDDPLAGILSDGSDDSFFDDDILGKKKPQKKGATANEKKNALFDLGESSEVKGNNAPLSSQSAEKSKNDNSSHTFETKQELYKPISPALSKQNNRKDSLKFEKNDSKAKPLSKETVGKSPAKSKVTTSVDRLDLLDELPIESKKDAAKPSDRGKNSQSLLDDILGAPSTKASGLKGTKSQNFDLDSILGKSDSKPTLPSNKKEAIKKTEEMIKKTVTKNVPQTKKASSEDWLGIFKDKDEESENDDNDMPAWLGGGESKKKKTSKETETFKSQQKSKQDTNQGQENVEKIDNQIKIETEFPEFSKVVAAPQKLEITEQDVTLEGAALCLQQQESQLMVALQLKAQDEKLAAMQMKQKESQRVQREAALAHHEQLDSMLRKQAEHRQQMQSIIATHQDRITQRIKALLGNSEVEINVDGNIEESNVMRQESPHTKEKKQLLQLVQSLQENHDKEIDLMETSYRRQLAFLEVSFTQAEERMKEESDKLVKFYSEKIDWLGEHHESYKKMAEANFNSLTERHKTENDMLRQQHLENIKILQEHHAALIENIRNSVQQEQMLRKDSVNFSTDLHDLVTSVKENNSKSDQLYEKIESLSNNTQRINEKSLQMRETQISDMLQQLKMERESFEKERTERKEIVNMLEARLRQMTTMIEEETATLRQKKMEFEFEKATFNKQTEFAKTVLKKQDEEIKLLKDDIQKEYQEKMSKLEEDRAKAIKDGALVAKEKASVQSLKLELEKTKAELQAQLEELAEERSKVNREKQELHIEEQRIVSKSRDLDLLAKTAIEKQSQADKKYSEAEFLQRKYEDRIRRIQEHVVSLNAREKQIAKEKVALSRERLSLHNERKEIEGRLQCSLCRSTQFIPEPTYRSAGAFSVPVSRDYRNISPVNGIEHEIAQIIGRGNFRSNINLDRADNEDAQVSLEPGVFKEYMDPKLMMLRLDVQQVISHLDQNKTEADTNDNDQEP